MTDRFDPIGNIRLLQSRRGVKASIDGLLLARFLRPLQGWRVADLGCGNGFVGLLMASEQPLCRVTGIEIQAVLLRQAAHSARLNHLSNISFLRADIKRPPWKHPLGRFDLVAANPPFRKVGTGRLSPDPVRAGARHELLGDVGDFARAAADLLRDGHSAGWVYLAERQGDLFDAAASAGLCPVRLRRVLPREGDEPSLILLKTVKGKAPGEVSEEPPLVLYGPGEGRDYTREAREIIYGQEKGNSE